MDSDVPEYNALSWVTVCLKHQGPLHQQNVTFLKARILSNTDRRTSILQLLFILSSDCFHCHSLHTDTHTHTHTLARTHSHAHARTHTHTHFMDPSSIQWWLEYEFAHKQYWNVTYNLVLVMNIHKYHTI